MRLRRGMWLLLLLLLLMLLLLLGVNVLDLGRYDHRVLLLILASRHVGEDAQHRVANLIGLRSVYVILKLVGFQKDSFLFVLFCFLCWLMNWLWVWVWVWV